MNSIVLNKTEQDTGQQSLPLWFYVFFTALIIMVSVSAAVYFYQRNVQESELRLQQQGLHILKQDLLLQDDVISTGWLRTLNPLVRNVQGGVIWSSELQRGIMHFRNLPVPKAGEHYHLWVYDLAKQAGRRVSSALFTTRYTPAGDYLIEIEPQEQIFQPYKFELVLGIPAHANVKLPEFGENAQALKMEQRNNRRNGLLHSERPLLLAQP